MKISRETEAIDEAQRNLKIEANDSSEHSSLKMNSLQIVRRQRRQGLLAKGEQPCFDFFREQ